MIIEKEKILTGKVKLSEEIKLLCYDKSETREVFIDDMDINRFYSSKNNPYNMNKVTWEVDFGDNQVKLKVIQNIITKNEIEADVFKINKSMREFYKKYELQDDGFEFKVRV